jgi:hypothetical protein
MTEASALCRLFVVTSCKRSIVDLVYIIREEGNDVMRTRCYIYMYICIVFCFILTIEIK